MSVVCITILKFSLYWQISFFSLQHQNLLRFVWKMVVSPSLCLCCFQTLNNSVTSHCSPQLLLPCDPPESEATTHPSKSVCAVRAATICTCVLRSILHSVSHIVPYKGNCICLALSFGQDGPLHCGAKLKLVPWEPGLDSVRSCCLMCHPWPRAMKQRGSYAQQPWPESALLHNSVLGLIFLVPANK